MKIKVLTIFLLFSLAFILQVQTMGKVEAQDNGTDLNLTSFPELLAEKLSISEFAGKILASLIIMLAFILPTALYTRSLIPPIFIGTLVMGFCIGIGYLDYWFLLVVAMLVAFMFASKIREVVTGD